MTSPMERWPAETDEAHPEVFTKIPLQPKDKKSGQLPAAMIKQFFEKGYVVVENFFSHEELDPCREAVKQEVDILAERMLKGGKLSSTYSDLGLFTRLTAMEKEFKGANILLHKNDGLPQAFRELWSNERLLNVVEQLIGPDIMGHPVWNLRSKTPQSEAATVPWHQDVSYLDNTSYSVLQPTAWIPLLDANEKNGCLEVAEGGHRSGRVARHQCCAGDTWYVMLEPEEMAKTLGVQLEKDLKILPVSYGGMVLFNNMIPHRSLQNFSDQVRWSLDLRWQSPDQPVGFHGLKEGVLMRSSKQPNLQIDWDTFGGVRRHTEQSSTATEVSDEFDTVITGPWMLRWEITHPNRHTDRLKDPKVGATGWHNIS